MVEFKCFEEWLAEGRVVKAGEKAGRWWVADGAAQTKALFAREQTFDMRGEGSVVSEKPKVQAAEKGKRVRYEYKDGKMLVWCGSHRDMIDLLTKSGYRFNPKLGRWRKDASKAQQEAFVKASEKRGYIVIDEGGADL